jgi:hypothetical protein
LERQGPLVSVPLDKKTGFPWRRSANRGLLSGTFRSGCWGGLFKPELKQDEIKLTGDLAKAGTLETTRVEAAMGWLLLACKRVPAAEQ